MLEIEGIIVSQTNYGETSKILNVLTKEGIIGVMAKGCRQLKSPLRSVTEPLVYGLFQMNYKENKLSILRSVDILDCFKNIKKDILNISYAGYLLKLSSQVAKQSQSEMIYTLLIESLIKIDEGYDPLVITNILELKYLDYLGVMPVVDRCSICGSTKAIETISADKGGYVCVNCIKRDRIVSDKTIKLIRMFYYLDILKISKVEISEISKSEINSFLEEYYERYTGLFLQKKTFKDDLKKIG